MMRLARNQRYSIGIPFCLVLTGLVILAWTNRIILDDALISFRYAENLVNGQGLVYNAGERVEGYTNFLWTLIMSLPFYLDLEPVKFSFLVSMLCFVASLILTYRIMMLILENTGKSIIGLVLLGTNYTFSSYATSGLETQFQTSLLTACVYVVMICVKKGDWDQHSLALLSILMAAAILTRLDSSIICMLAGSVAMYGIVTQRVDSRESAFKIGVLILPALIVVSAWLAWKYSYYGELLPNTFYSRTFSLRRGLKYIFVFFRSYWMLPHVGLAFAAAVWLLKNRVSASHAEIRIAFLIGILMAAVMLWFAYVAKVGGDFMEFRFIVPVMPLLYCLLSWLTLVMVCNPVLRTIFLAFLVIGSIRHFQTFNEKNYGWETHKIETIHMLRAHIWGEWEDWYNIGQTLGQCLKNDRNVIIATTAAGAIPFYSRLQTIDMLGLSDKWVARHGTGTSFMAGHQKVATMDYLIKRGVNLMIAHPWTKRQIRGSGAAGSYRLEDIIKRLNQSSFMSIKNEKEIPVNSKIIEIPINKNYMVAVLYVKQSRTVDDAISTCNWKVFPIQRATS